MLLNNFHTRSPCRRGQGARKPKHETPLFIPSSGTRHGGRKHFIQWGRNCTCMLVHQTLGSVCAQATVRSPQETPCLPGLHLLRLTAQVTSAVSVSSHRTAGRNKALPLTGLAFLDSIPEVVVTKMGLWIKKLSLGISRQSIMRGF